MQPLGTSFLAVDNELYVYKVDEDEQIIFKISSFKMKLAKTMNSKNEEQLPSEFCFFDGKVKRTKGKLLHSFFTKTSAVSGNRVYKRR